MMQNRGEHQYENLGQKSQYYKHTEEYHADHDENSNHCFGTVNVSSCTMTEKKTEDIESSINNLAVVHALYLKTESW